MDKALQETVRGLMEKARAKFTAAEDWLQFLDEAERYLQSFLDKSATD